MSKHFHKYQNKKPVCIIQTHYRGQGSNPCGLLSFFGRLND